MPDRDNFVVEDLISRTASLLEGVEGVEQLVSGTLGELPAQVEEKVRQEEIEGIQRSMGLVVDGWFTIDVAKDEMTCLADFHPPQESGEPVSLERFQEALVKCGVTIGLDWSAVESALLTCNLEREEVSNVLVARGAHAEDGLAEHIELDPSLLAAPVAEPETSRVDHRERSPFRVVKKGDVLARRVPAKPGTEGSTVTGRMLPFKVRRLPGLQSGENTELVGETVIASCDGRLLHDERSFRVSPVLEIGGDLDYHTGNVDFRGDVMVSGTVKDGFKLKSTGSILCQRTVGATEVSAGGDVILRSGFIGRDRGKIHAGGRFEAKFVENGYVEALGPIRIEVGAMNSALHTLGMLETGAKAIIVGGTISAGDGVDAMHIGSRVGVRTEIYCGTNFSVMQKLELVRDNVMKLAQRIREVERLKASGKGNQSALAELEAKLRAAVTKMNQASIHLIPGLDKNESAQVVAHGTVYPGVYIEICHIPFIVQREMVKVRFKLDKTQGKVVAERLPR